MPRTFTYPQLANEAWLREQYETRKRSTVQIAREVGCTVQNVNKHLRRHGITLRPSRQPASFTREEVDAAVHDGVGLVVSELGLGERDADLLHLTAAVQLAKLGYPPLFTLNEVIERDYDVPPAEVRGWWDRWS
jgi:hypothetical protein